MCEVFPPVELQVCYITARLLTVWELLKVYINWLSCSVEHPQIHILVKCLPTMTTY